MKNVVLLGATGSIGQSTQQVIAAHPHALRLLGAVANSNRDALDALQRRFDVPHTALFAEEGPECLERLATLPEADVVVVATTGTVALQATLAAIKAGKSIALAAKEILVLAGHLVMPAAHAAGVPILPVDSEHNALFQCLQALHAKADLRRILLTASGGPFRNRPAASFASITPQEALQHPNWDMGPKITIDSATMANKGLEVLEARWLFDLQPEAIAVLVHPQSIVHSMVECVDGSVIAQLAPPSMTFPIQHCLFFPHRATPPAPTLDFNQALQLDFAPPDFDRFPCLRLAFEALHASDPAPAIFNAANAVAVDAFVAGRLPFTGIPRLIEATLAACQWPRPDSVAAVNAMESAAIEAATRLLAERC